MAAVALVRDLTETAWSMHCRFETLVQAQNLLSGKDTIDMNYNRR